MRLRFIGAVLLTVFLCSCATHYSPNVVADPYGIFSGVWHGILFPFALTINIVSWFMNLLGFSLWQSIEIIGRPNTGFWYYSGFFVGLVMYGGGA